MKIVINPEYHFLEDYIVSLPGNFDSRGTIIYKGRNVLKSDKIENIPIVVKKFKTPHFINRLAYSFFRSSKARRSYEYSQEILKRGLKTAYPIGYVERYTGGLLADSYYISIYEKEAETIREYVADCRPQDFLLRQAFGSYTAKMHQAKILHIDYSPGNILVKRQGKDFLFSLIDVNRMKFGKVSSRVACKNFARLATSREALSEIAARYAADRNFNINEFVECTNLYSDRYFKQYAFRLAYKKWKQEGHSWFTQPYFQYIYYRNMSSCPFISLKRKICYKEKSKAVYNTYIKLYDFRKVFAGL